MRQGLSSDGQLFGWLQPVVGSETVRLDSLWSSRMAPSCLCGKSFPLLFCVAH